MKQIDETYVKLFPRQAIVVNNKEKVWQERIHHIEHLNCVGKNSIEMATDIKK